MKELLDSQRKVGVDFAIDRHDSEYGIDGKFKHTIENTEGHSLCMDWGNISDGEMFE